MKKLWINPLSPMGQCGSSGDAVLAIAGVVECLARVNDIIAAGRATIYFDDRLDERVLGPDDPYGIAISKLINTPHADLAKKWFVYKRRFVRLQAADCSITMSSADGMCSTVVQGDVSEGFFEEGISSISFGGRPLMESTSLHIQSGMRSGSFPNYCNRAALEKGLPFFKASPKHRKNKYFDRPRGEWVAPMSLPDDIAQSVLDLSVEAGGDYFGYHAPSKKIIRFKNTRGLEFHGFEIELAELPAGLADLIIRND